MANLMMPGSPRYQPKDLVPYFGYDNLMRPVGEVEIANLQVLGEIGVIPSSETELLTPEVVEALLSITTTVVDETERKVTKHDIRAWIHEAKKVMPQPLHRWVHVLLTSYDALDTARILGFNRAYTQAIRPKLLQVIRILAGIVKDHAQTLQIGRTHGQHALPITVGFWLATVLSRILSNLEEMDAKNEWLVGKISGAVGAYNAQSGLGIEERCGQKSFERRLLEKLGLEPARVSTQVLPPEPLAYFLHAQLLTTASFAQLGRDCRHLMRSEIAEIAESFEQGQVGSSTMAQKRNPINFEQLEGMWLRTKNEYGKVLDTMISEHQRDLVGSSAARDFPIISINLMQQINTLLRENKDGVPFLSRIKVDERACSRNFHASGNLVMAEPVYIALQIAGYGGDAHKVVNEQAVERARSKGEALISVVEAIAAETGDRDLLAAVTNIPQQVRELLRTPWKYVGRAGQIANDIAAIALQMSA